MAATKPDGTLWQWGFPCPNTKTPQQVGDNTDLSGGKTGVKGMDGGCAILKHGDEIEMPACPIWKAVFLEEAPNAKKRGKEPTHKMGGSTKGGAPAPEIVPTSVHLHVLGKNRQTTRAIEFAGEKLIIGSGDGCDLKITEPFVSSRHATIERREDGFILLDDHSRNGTFLDERRIWKSRVWVGDCIRLGQVELVLREELGMAKSTVTRRLAELGLVDEDSEA